MKRLALGILFSLLVISPLKAGMVIGSGVTGGSQTSPTIASIGITADAVTVLPSHLTASPENAMIAMTAVSATGAAGGEACTVQENLYANAADAVIWMAEGTYSEMGTELYASKADYAITQVLFFTDRSVTETTGDYTVKIYASNRTTLLATSDILTTITKYGDTYFHFSTPYTLVNTTTYFMTIAGPLTDGSGGKVGYMFYSEGTEYVKGKNSGGSWVDVSSSMTGKFKTYSGTCP